MSTCDKCGKDVPMANDTTVIEATMTGQPTIVLFCGARHFLPTADCEGSPSRAQYIEGQPRDTRGYTYDPEMESKWRKAYEEVQRRYAGQ